MGRDEDTELEKGEDESILGEGEEIELGTSEKGFEDEEESKAERGAEEGKEEEMDVGEAGEEFEEGKV